MENSNIKIRRYLLGSLTSDEAEELDLRIIADEKFADELNFAENELIEDYLDKSLAPDEADLFGRHFLVSPARERHLRQILMLRNYAQSAVEQDVYADAPEKTKESFFDKLWAIFSTKIGFTAAALALLMVVSLIGLTFYGERQTALESEFAQLNQKEFSNLSEFENLKRVNLMAGNFRGAGAAGNLQGNQMTERVLFQLALPATANAADTFRAQILKDGKSIFTQNDLRFYNNPNGQELRFLLPSTILKKGAYQIKVEKTAARDSTFNYDFSVQ